jgi:excisionase family DNA binding protein
VSAPNYLTVDSFAERLDTDDMTVRRLIAAGLIEAIDIRQPGGKRARLRIPESELTRIRTAMKLGATSGRKKRT